MKIFDGTKLQSHKSRLSVRNYILTLHIVFFCKKKGGGKLIRRGKSFHRYHLALF